MKTRTMIVTALLMIGWSGAPAAPADDRRIEDKNARDQGPTNDRDAKGEKIDDGSITAQVKYQLFAHASTTDLKTKVNTNQGHVVISGEARTTAEKDLVTKLARSVRGVIDVENKMTVARR